MSVFHRAWQPIFACVFFLAVSSPRSNHVVLPPVVSIGCGAPPTCPTRLHGEGRSTQDMGALELSCQWILRERTCPPDCSAYACIGNPQDCGADRTDASVDQTAANGLFNAP